MIRRLGVFGAVLLIGGCSFPIRIVRVTPWERAEAEVSKGERARTEGRLAEARDHYRRAVELAPDHLQAWCELRLVSTPEQRGEIVRELSAAEPESPRVAFVRGLFAEDLRERERWFSRAWVLAGGDYLPVLDPWLVTPERVAGWRRYTAWLGGLEPAGPTGALREAIAHLELGEVEAARATAERVEGLPAADATLQAYLVASGALSGDVENALSEARRRIPDAPSRYRRFLQWEVDRLQVVRFLEQDDTEKARDWLRRMRSERPQVAELDVLEARRSARLHEDERALALLEGSVHRCVTPRLRVAGAVLYHRLAREHSPGRARRELLEALHWAPRNRDLEAIGRLFLEAGDPRGAARALEILSQRTPRERDRRRIAEDLRTLEALPRTTPWLAEAWAFLRHRPITERQKAYAAMSPTGREPALRAALTHPDSRLRRLALKLLRSEDLPRLDEVAATLARDGDAAVRAAWILLAAERGGARARQAILAGREDPDAYVREVAGRLPLPD